MDDFEFEVAFSFNAVDESLAVQLNDLLSDRLKTFIYSERQREIAGKDGQEKFSEVYGRTARLVVILYRPEWGQTPWTRVEQTAIRQRAFDHGWDFTTFIPMAADLKMPEWLPKTRLYVGLERFGLSGAAAVIEAKVAELGGCPQQESIKERAERFKRAQHIAAQQRQFLKSQSGVQAASAAYEVFSIELERLASDLKTSNIQITTKRSQEFRIVSGISPINLLSDFRPYYANDLEGAYLTLNYFRGFPRIPGSWGSAETATKLRQLKYSYEMVGIDRFAYVGLSEQRREFTPQQLADHALQQYLDVAEKNPLNH